MSKATRRLCIALRGREEIPADMSADLRRRYTQPAGSFGHYRKRRGRVGRCTPKSVYFPFAESREGLKDQIKAK